MKRLCVLLVGFCLFGTCNLWAYESRGARSCEGWLQSSREEADGYPKDAEIYETWLIGYLSGIVAGSGTDFLIGTDNESVFQMVGVYCTENRTMNLAGAGTFVARQLMQQKGIVHRPTLP
mgnify:CR=1 FL=1